MGFELRPYQCQSVDATLIDLNSGLMRLANILPTGAGKTEIMAKTVDEWKRVNPHRSVLVLSHLSLLTNQSYNRFKLRVPGLSVGIRQGKHQPSPMNDVVISTMQTAREPGHIDSMRQTLIKPVGLVVIDETHMLPTASYETILGYFPNCPMIGYTATPFREKKLMTNYFDKISFTISLQELIEQKELVPPELMEIVQEDEVGGQDEGSVLRRVVALYKAHEDGKKAIVFLKEVAEAKLLAMALQTIGVKARTVTGDVTDQAREDVFEAFLNDEETKVLTTVNVLTAGFDAPQVEAIFMPYGTKSPTQYLQRVGRGLRKAPGKTSCRVYMPGDAPKVMTKFYEKINKLCLHAGRKAGSFDTFTEDLEYMFAARSEEIYHWTEEVVKVVNRMEKIGMSRFAQLLDSKQFPPHFLKSITELLKRLPAKSKKIPHGDKPASVAQKSVLFENGFNSAQVELFNKAEASMMISAIFNRENDPKYKFREFVVPEGKFKGRHVSELPFAYRAQVRKLAPDGALVAMINSWESRKKRRA